VGRDFGAVLGVINGDNKWEWRCTQVVGCNSVDQQVDVGAFGGERLQVVVHCDAKSSSEIVEFASGQLGQTDHCAVSARHFQSLRIAFDFYRHRFFGGRYVHVRCRILIRYAEQGDAAFEQLAQNSYRMRMWSTLAHGSWKSDELKMSA
jgi:hypothetical protein